MAVDDDTAGDELNDESSVAEPDDTETEPGTRPAVKTAVIAGVAAVTAIAGVAGWLGFGAYQSGQAEQQRELFLQVGRQGALNLTTLSHTEIDADVSRILDSSTGAFHDDFKKRAPVFVNVVRQAQSTSEGTVTEAGLESVTADSAQVLVTVSVQTSSAGTASQDPRSWRMRIGVQKIGDQAKVSNVEFVP